MLDSIPKDIKVACKIMLLLCDENCTVEESGSTIKWAAEIFSLAVKGRNIECEITTSKGREAKNMKDTLLKQIELLAKWNEENGKCEPEQARKNAETILQIAQFIGSNYGEW